MQNTSLFQDITIQRLSVGSLFKLVALGLGLTLIPFSLLMGCLALFGASTVGWNQQPLTGVTGLLAAPLMGIFLTAIFTLLIGTSMAIGLWLHARFRPLTLRVKAPRPEPRP